MKTKQHISTYFRFVRVPLSILLIGAGSASFAGSQPQRQYTITDLPSLGGTNSRANSINNRDWLAGYSNLAGNQSRHAALWRNGLLTDLGTLGGPNSNVTWSVKADTGIVTGIAQTAMPEPLGEAWSSAAFYPGATGTGYINLGFVWQNGQMRGLPNFPGGDNGFATGANNRHRVVGWAENDVHDPTCVSPQVLQFRPAIWTLGPPDEIHELPLIPGDTSGAATAINDKDQVVGISGICDQAVGRYTAKHAVLWQNGGVMDLGNLGAEFWNTPTNINHRGDIVGFAGAPNDPDGNFLQAFIWTAEQGMQPLGFLPGDVHSEAYGINERRQVVGLSCDADGNCRAFIWQSGVMRDLNDFKPPSYVATLEQARDINEAGQIAGRSIDAAGVRRAFLATPIGHND